MTAPDPATAPVATVAEFKRRWAGVHNFLMAGQCVPFTIDLPPIDRVVEELRQSPTARITPGSRGDALDVSTDIAASFRAMSIERALASPFALAHFKLSEFDAPGKCLHGFKERVLDRWTAALRAWGFTWTRCYPIIFISGPGCATNYHMDFSHVLACQVYGTKRFCGLRDPDRWAPRDARVAYKPGQLAKPQDLTDADTLCFTMRPGDVLWNALLTPHWVEASDHEVALSVNISHGGLRLDGKLCPHEQELEDYRASQPQTAPAPVAGTY